MRILPHHQDSGGFFVAVLEKVAPLYFSERVRIINQTIPSNQTNHKNEYPSKPQKQNK